MNNEVKEFCTKHNITEKEFYGKQRIHGSLNLSTVTKLPDGFKLYTDFLNLSGITVLPDDFRVTTLYELDLKSLIKLPKNFKPICNGGGLYLNSLIELPNNFNLEVCGVLTLNSLTKIPENANLTVTGDLNLDSVTEISDNVNINVDGLLYMPRLTKISEHANIKAGSIFMAAVNNVPISNNINIKYEKEIYFRNRTMCVKKNKEYCAKIFL